MKIFPNTIRTTAIAGLFSMASLLSFSQQDSKVWLTIENTNNVPVENASGVLISNDASFNTAISSLNITSGSESSSFFKDGIFNEGLQGGKLRL